VNGQILAERSAQPFRDSCTKLLGLGLEPKTVANAEVRQRDRALGDARGRGGRRPMTPLAQELVEDLHSKTGIHIRPPSVMPDERQVQRDSRPIASPASAPARANAHTESTS
jgi:hypothetical protein